MSVGGRLSSAARRLLGLTPADPYGEPVGTAPVLVVPGLRNSGAQHWQTLWEAERSEFRRVIQRDWQVPDLEAWAGEVASVVRAAAAPPLVVAHGFGCLATVRAALTDGAPIRAALLVAPMDPETISVESLVPERRLPFASALVASSNDPWMKLVKAGNLASLWGSRFVAYRNAGHINAESGYGPWPDAVRLLRQVEAKAQRRSVADVVAHQDPAHAAR